MTKLKYILGGTTFLFLATIAVATGYNLAFRNLVFPRVVISGVEVTGMDKDTSVSLLNARFRTDPTAITLLSNGKEVSKLEGITVKTDPVWAVDQAMSVGRNGNILTQITEQVKTILHKQEIKVPVKVDPEELNNLIEKISEDIDQKPTWPKLKIDDSGVKLVKGNNGILVKRELLISEIMSNLALPGKHEISIPTDFINTAEDSNRVQRATEALRKWSDKSLTIHFRDFDKKLKREEIAELFGLNNEDVNSASFEGLVAEVKPRVEIEPRDAVFIFENGKVNEFKPEVVGAQIDIPKFRDKLAEAILLGEEKVLEVPAILTYPKIKTGDINNLGIKELIGTGTSSFSHSIPGRVFNVNLAASRVNGTLVAPGEEFSFNRAVGDISKATGYQTAYVISQGKTVLGDGGGVCQVSTTTFRAALEAGLPITERRAHAYRVGYYEQDSPPGIDATIYYPSADLKFLNDTGNYILLQEEVDTKKMTMKVNIYGTSDGRRSSISKPVISSQTPPPPTIYVDDPTLPLGTTKQIDWSAWGARVSFEYNVERNGENIYKKTFVSNYQPWQAVYLKGTGN